MDGPEERTVGRFVLASSWVALDVDACCCTGHGLLGCFMHAFSQYVTLRIKGTPTPWAGVSGRCAAREEVGVIWCDGHSSRQMDAHGR